MLDNMCDSFEHRYVVALRRDARRQPDSRCCADNCDGFDYPGLKKPGQFPGRLTAARIKLGIPFAMVRQTGYARTDPLPDVPRKMQHQIADRVFVF